MACHLRGLPSVHQLWDICCVATGRPAVFESDAAAVIPPDGVLFTSTDHDFQGLVGHRGWERGSCGMLQGLIYVWPPPAGVRRLGAAFSAYKPHPELMERAEMLAVAGWSSSPEGDWRTSPAPALGSPPAPKGEWPVIGGVVVAKAEAVAMSPSERAQIPGRFQGRCGRCGNTCARARGVGLSRSSRASRWHDACSGGWPERAGGTTSRMVWRTWWWCASGLVARTIAPELACLAPP